MSKEDRRPRLAPVPVVEKSEELKESLTSEARAELLAILDDMDLNNPGSKHRTSVATKNIGSQVARLTVTVDDVIQDIWTNVIEECQQN